MTSLRKVAGFITVRQLGQNYEHHVYNSHQLSYRVTTYKFWNLERIMPVYILMSVFGEKRSDYHMEKYTLRSKTNLPIVSRGAGFSFPMTFKGCWHLPHLRHAHMNSHICMSQTHAVIDWCSIGEKRKL